jgi:PST family polysaccharide transporter
MSDHSRSGFLSNLMAFGASEAASKATRLLVVIAVSRNLDAAAVGYAAAALAVGETIKALTENGIGQRIIAARPDQLRATCQTAHRLFWHIGIALTVGQAAVGAALWASGQTVVGLLIALMALEYLFMPAGLVQAALAMREGHLKRVALIAGGQIAGANLLTVSLALIWPSPLVLILPRVLTAPVWLLAMRRLRPWTSIPAAPRAATAPFLKFGVPVTGIELVRSLRLHADKVVVGALAGPEVLGAWFLAFNAGLSLANAFSTALSTVLFPHLCRSDDPAAAARNSAFTTVLAILPVAVLQSLLAPWYVPLLLGSHWADLAPAISVLCLAAVPLALWTSVASGLRVRGQTGREFTVTLVLALGLTAGTALATPEGIVTMATTYAAICAAVLITASLLFMPAPRFPNPGKA